MTTDTNLPDTIGPYEVLDRIGSGGAGIVYRALQREPLLRAVAVKVLRPGMDSEDVLRRFSKERQALALLDHDHVARIFDAGVTDSGRPYFVMELIDGAPLDRFCAEHSLSVTERIALFQQICAGVQHAHQKGILHRDLKPSNVLVTLVDERPVAKIIDFGLARSVDSDGESLHTGEGNVVGTPGYMSPEQVDARTWDIDTRTDVYSLGVLFYETLTGRLPFEGAEVAPTRPSERVSASGGSPPSRRLASVLRGELDWIVLKALEGDPERRYQTAAGLSLDLQRYLEHEPVSAGPPSSTYRMRRYLRRYRKLAFASIAVLVALSVSAIGTTVGFVRAEQRQRRFDSLAAVLHCDAALSRALTLQPAWPAQRAAMREWLERDSATALGQRELIARTRRELETAALDGRKHFAVQDREKLQEEQKALLPKLAAWTHAAEVHEKRAAPAEIQLDQQAKDAGWQELMRRAWPSIHPNRTEFGKEAEGLVLARAALKKRAKRVPPDLYLTLAWAEFANGLYEEAEQSMTRAVEAARRRDKPTYADVRGRLVAAIQAAPTQLEGLRERNREIESLLRMPALASDAEQVLLDKLTRLQPVFLNLERTDAQVRRRLEWAERIEELTTEHPNARASWAEAARAIRTADGVTASQRYKSYPFDLQPQWGLVPIGMNPKTKLWEFYHLRSAFDPRSGTDPRTLPIPSVADYDEYGGLAVGPATGIVFILMPAGEVWVGDQDTDPAAPNYDKNKGGDQQPVHKVDIRKPFFIGKHELSRAQWRRLGNGSDPSTINLMSVAFRPEGFDIRNGRILPNSDTAPVGNVSWDACAEVLRYHGLDLPTEAQWEYAARAGTQTRYFTGHTPVSLRHYANVLDMRTKSILPWPGAAVPFDDGYAHPAPVGSMRPNPWGLHHVIGNASEWCKDCYAPYDTPTDPESGERIFEESARRTARGGSCNGGALGIGSALRFGLSRSIAVAMIGVRPARIVQTSVEDPK